MKKILLSGKNEKGKFVTVSDEDFEWLIQYKWHDTGRYARRVKQQQERILGSKTISMHRMIFEKHFGNIPEGLEIDHIDGNGFNNQLSNLRLVTSSENNFNRKKGKNNKSGYKGVSYKKWFDKRYNKLREYWIAQIDKAEKSYSKHFSFTEEGKIEAALWYDQKARELSSECASLNFIYLTK